jgi:ATP-dependent DNA helicase RecQ
MNYALEWQNLKKDLREKTYDHSLFENQYFSRLLQVLVDDKSTEADQLLAYRDAILASKDPVNGELPCEFSRSPKTLALAKRFGLSITPSITIRVDQANFLCDVDLAPIYGLERRRLVRQRTIDPALKARLGQEAFTHYNGKAQQVAVRLAITQELNSTLIVNLPTGCGKTLVAHAVSLFSRESQLTLVIVPTIGLAIEQGARAQELFDQNRTGHGGAYYWHGGQTQHEHDEIKNRIRDQKQRILFCSPEAACRSLLPVLFKAARQDSLACIVIDEAHIVDQWGAEFRPYFQIIASLTRSLRACSPQGIKCVLLSATFSSKSMRLLEDLFSVEGKECIHVNGSFLRPEIQYKVQRVRSDERIAALLEATVALPKPLIIYTLYPDDAERIFRAVESIGLSRIRLFTGTTSPEHRKRILKEWASGDIDVIIGTSAFGLGMDKANVRSIIHAAIPENLDRFYQEVGRGGRDGCACQSLLIYSDHQIGHARRLNTDRLITVELGYRKWRTMWEHGSVLPDGRRNLHVSSLRDDQRGKTDGNEEWNWRTLLLMQRAGLIRVELQEPTPPEISDSANEQEYRDALKRYYDQYYDNVTISSQVDNPLNQSEWKKKTRERREYEKYERRIGLNVLIDWLNNNEDDALCEVLLDYYTIDGIQPEYSCGGCPNCLKRNATTTHITLGNSVYMQGAKMVTDWNSPLAGSNRHLYTYYRREGLSQRSLVRNWAHWIRPLVECGAILALRANRGVLAALQKELKTNVFWIGNELDEDADSSEIWPELILLTDVKETLPMLGISESLKILVAPGEIADASNPYRKWWESQAGTISIDNFLREIGQ